MLTIKDCKVIVKNYLSTRTKGILNSAISNGNLTISNLSIDLQSNSLEDNFHIINGVQDKNIYNLGGVIENIVVNANFKQKSFKDEIYDYFNLKNYIFNSSKGNSYYYGDEFDAFYISWRTGKVGLVTLDGRGFFQGKIDEEWLGNNNYEKREV